MEVILVLLVVAILNGAIAFIDDMLGELIPMSLYADQYMFSASGSDIVGVLFDIVFGLGVSLLLSLIHI